MAYYLQMDGVDDFIQLPSVSFTDIVMDFYSPGIATADTNGVIIDANTGASNDARVMYRNGAFYQDYPAFNCYVDNVNVGFSGGLFPENTRFIGRFAVITDFMTAPIVDDVTFFCSFNHFNFISAAVYDIKIYNGATLVAWYDMTLGNVQDQSGNGKHATLTGGTWVADATGTAYTSSLSDSVTMSESFVKSIAKSRSESLTLTDSLRKAITVTVIDSVTLSDSISKTQGKAINLSDTITITDALNKALSQCKTDSITLTDSRSGSVIKGFTDSLSITDTIVSNAGKAIILSDSLTLTDALTKAVGLIKSDSILLSDSISKTANVTVRLYDVLITTDSISLFLPGAPVIVHTIELMGGIRAAIELRGEIEISPTNTTAELRGGV